MKNIEICQEIHGFFYLLGGFLFHGALLLFVQQLPLQATRQRLLHAHRARSTASVALGVAPHLRVALPDLGGDSQNGHRVPQEKHATVPRAAEMDRKIMSLVMSVINKSFVVITREKGLQRVVHIKSELALKYAYYLFSPTYD